MQESAALNLQMFMEPREMYTHKIEQEAIVEV